MHSAREHGLDARLLAAVEAVNERQKQRAVREDQQLLRRQARRPDASRSGASRSSRIPTTCARRRAATLMEALWAAGAKVRAYDPGRDARGAAHLRRARRSRAVPTSAEQALDGADALAIVTEWQEFRSPDFDAIRDALRFAGDLRRTQSVRSGPRTELRPSLLCDWPWRTPDGIGLRMTPSTVRSAGGARVAAA